jgi:ABC-type multidrug transport system ATPase subunit/ABC-type multidrug transport system permease subunit
MSKKNQIVRNQNEILTSEDNNLVTVGSKIYDLSLRLTWRNLSYSYKKGKKEVSILKSVSGHANSGEILAILGASGCGKSTLLSILADQMRSQSNATSSGSLYLNDSNVENLNFSSYVSFLPQQNIFFDFFTVKESLNFIGHLKLGIKKKPLEKKISKVLKLLKIHHLAGRKIGNSFKRGLSGGEVKRVCIAIELICDSPILILDEPTSGLDSATALIIIKVLKKLSNKGKMVIFSVHQPGNKFYSLFDRMILMTGGKFAYQGPREDCLSHFSDLGFHCPKYLNPAEFLIKTIHVENVLDPSEEELLKLKKFFDACGKEEEFEVQGVNFKEIKKISFSGQVKELFKRSSFGFLRSPIGMLFQVIKAVVLVVIVICLFYDLGKDSKGINDRKGVLICGIYNVLYFPMLIESFTFPIERNLVHKEINEGMYSVEAYFLSKLFVDLCVYVGFSIIMNLIVYYPIGLNDSSPDKLFIGIGILILSQINGLIHGYIAGGLSSNAQMASIIGPVLSTPPVLFSGFFSDVRSIPDAFEWLKYTTPYFYSYQAMLLNEFDGLDVDEAIRPTPEERFYLHGQIKDYVYMFLVNIFVSLIIAYLIVKVRAIKSVFVRKSK